MAPSRARPVRAARPDLTGIRLSGHGMEADVQSSRDAGFVEHLTKPVDVRLLHAAIGRAVRRMSAADRPHGDEQPAPPA